ncbi:MAG: isocitrate/isopropylmalate family dehydrogenase [Methanobacteriaceae archaeon]
MKKIAVIPGDGIGKEVMEANIDVLDTLDLNLDYEFGEAGEECFLNNGSTILDETLKIAKKCEATLFGAVTSVPGEKSAIITLRKELETYGNLRPIKSYKGVNSLYNDIDILVVRENSEGLYSGIETSQEDAEGLVSKAIATRIITKKATEKITKLGFEKALESNYKKVTCVHKANVLKKTDGLFKDTFWKLAKEYQNKYKTNNYKNNSHCPIEVNELYVDAAAMFLAMDPYKFDVIITSNLYGDILSDLAAGLVGGLGLAPSANIGEKNGLFEPVHGSAPDIAGQNISNPIAMLLSTSMMLEFLKFQYESTLINEAISKILKEKKVATPDLGGTNKTMEIANEIISKL